MAAPNRPAPHVLAIPRQWHPDDTQPFGRIPQIPRSVPKRRVWPWLLGGAAGIVVLLVAIVGIAALPSRTTSTSSAGAAPSTSSAARSASVTRQPQLPPVLGPAKAITAREWQMIAKNPAANVGKRIVVYGVVTQFDAVTGTAVFRANVDGVEHRPKYGFANYPTNTILTGEAAILANLVQDDLFKAEATVSGPITYDTAIGGQTTAPSLVVSKIEIIGQVD